MHCYLFDKLIKPVIDYGREIWNFTISEKNDSLEIIHCKFCKFALGIFTNATNLAINGKLEHTPLSVYIYVRIKLLVHAGMHIYT